MILERTWSDLSEEAPIHHQLHLLQQLSKVSKRNDEKSTWFATVGTCLKFEELGFFKRGYNYNFPQVLIPVYGEIWLCSDFWCFDLILDASLSY